MKTKVIAVADATDPLAWAKAIWDFITGIGIFYLQMLGFKIAKDSITPPDPTTFLNNLIILLITVIVGYLIAKYIIKIL